MTRYVIRLQPNSIRELAAMVALYRPGPMDHIPRFIDTKFKKIEAEYMDPRMKPILEETYGIIVYQDQVMQLVQALAGFSLGKADVLRRAMGKKDAKAMADMKVEFADGCKTNGVAEQTVEKVWELLLPFAGYAFNKAHAVCYAILSYQTAYLKANYPVEYMAALLSVYLDKEDRVTAFIEESRRMKIPILPPDVNASVGDFAIEGGSIRFGLTAIKGVGGSLVEGIIQERTESGRYKHLYEFTDRTKPYGMNRTALEALIRAGALDGIDTNRRKLLNCVDGALAYADTQNRSRLAGQDSLFGGDGGPQSVSYPALPDCDAPGRNENLSMEKEVIGIYVSDHPLRGHERTITQNSTHTCASIAEQDEQVFVKIAGVIAKMRVIVTKNEGKRMASLVIEDFTGQATAVAFPATFEKLKDVLLKDTVVQLTGYVMHREMRGEKSIELRIEDVKKLEAELDLGNGTGGNSRGIVTLNVPRATKTQFMKLRQIIEDSPGDYEVLLQFPAEGNCHQVYLTHHVKPDDMFKRAVQECLYRCDIDITDHNSLGMAA